MSEEISNKGNENSNEEESHNETSTRSQREDLPADVNEELAHVNEMMELLALNRVWFPGYSPAKEFALNGGIACAIGAFILLLLLAGYALDSGDDSPWLVLAVIIVLLAMITGIMSAAYALFTHNSTPQPAFILDADGSLWCVIPDEDEIPPVPFSKREIVTLREQLGGYARSLNNHEIAFAIDYIRAIHSLREGSPLEGYDISLIEDIEGYGNEDDSTNGNATKGENPPNTVCLEFTDRTTNNLERLEIERTRWKSFMSWLDQEFEYSEE